MTWGLSTVECLCCSVDAAIVEVVFFDAGVALSLTLFMSLNKIAATAVVIPDA